MEVGINFNNILSYNENMSKGMADKLFFLNKINFNKGESYLFIDFGCADGALLDAIYGIICEKGISAYFIGYDISDTMIELAKTKFSHCTSSVMFTSSWKEVEEKVKNYSAMTSVLILSSVIHEVYSYAESQDDVDLFWHRVLDTGFKYVCVRDMMVSKDSERSSLSESAENKVYEKTKSCSSSGLYKYRTEFEDIYGKLFKSWKNLLHFLLKYRWTINWNREVHENYFPIYMEDFLNKFEEKYNLNYLKRFRVPFLNSCWKTDFDINENEISDNTHIKAIFELKRI